MKKAIQYTDSDVNFGETHCQLPAVNLFNFEIHSISLKFCCRIQSKNIFEPGKHSRRQ